MKHEHTPLTKCVSWCANEMQSPSPTDVCTFSLLVLLADHHWNMPYCLILAAEPLSPDSTLLTVNRAHLQVRWRSR